MRGFRRVAFFVVAAVFAVPLGACGEKSADAASVVKSAESASKTSAAKSEKPPSMQPDKVKVYYFHGTRRCPTCLGIQKSIGEAIDDSFKKELEAGMLEFEEVNFEEAANKHFIEVFQLTFSTMIVAAQAGDETIEWENARKVWDHAHNPSELKNYVKSTIRKYLKMVME
jgi:hypothetical protein